MIPLRKTLQLGAAALAAWATLAVAHSDTTSTRELKVSQLAPGVYTIRHPDPTDDFPDGNTTVVIGEREVLVIDTCYLPSSADGDIARIRQWTGKPVRWVLNTHWHNDHIGGNHRYRLAWPGVQIVGHDETRRMIDARVRSYVRRFAAADSAFGKQRDALRKTAEQGVDAKGAAVDAAGRKAAAESLKKLESAAAQFRDITLDPPNVTFVNELRIDLGGRIVELKHLGRGNTGGDVVAWLPAERILIAGDLVDSPVPYAFGGYPTDWIGTLGRLAAMDPAVVVPGHGDALQGKGYIERVAALLRNVRDQVTALIDRNGSGITLEEVQKTVDLTEARRAFAGDDADNKEFFDESMAGLIRSVYAEAKAR
jgi:glyoxylase-like metal-dependent hydrolase (beta-lactamase superfamily II)